LVETKEQREQVKNIILNFHSYVPTYRSVGRRIDYLVYYGSDLIGMIGIGSATYPPPKALLEFLGISKNKYRKFFNSIANNWRFCFKRRIKNLGSRTLKELRIRAKKDWKRKYGDDLQYICTFVGGGRDGAVYKADNWKFIGKTAGLPKHKSTSMKWSSKSYLKNHFVKPTGKNRKLIFITKL